MVSIGQLYGPFVDTSWRIFFAHRIPPRLVVFSGESVWHRWQEKQSLNYKKGVM